MNHRLSGLVTALLFVLLTCAPLRLLAVDKPLVDDERCPVCGMFVAKYQEWLTRIELSNGKVLTFDGVKDMMAYYFNPQQFGAESGAKPVKVWVKDYYTLDWLEASSALYVLGGDVLGPMGNELIPFNSTEAAETFMADHHGEKIITFAEIDVQLIDRLRMGDRMMKSMHQ